MKENRGERQLGKNRKRRTKIERQFQLGHTNTNLWSKKSQITHKKPTYLKKSNLEPIK